MDRQRDAILSIVAASAASKHGTVVRNGTTLGYASMGSSPPVASVCLLAARSRYQSFYALRPGSAA
jgi:hypothetical protein